MSKYTSVGVYSREKDASLVVPGAATSGAATVISSIWGPMSLPQLVGSEADIVALYGKPVDETASSFFTAADFLAYSNQMFINRIETDSTNAVSKPVEYKLSRVDVLAAGRGYTQAATATFSAPASGGVTATGVVNVVAGKVESVVVGNPGTDYASNTTITFGAPASGGVTATGLVVLRDSPVTNVVLNSGGGGYDPLTTTVTFSAPEKSNGIRATGTAVVSQSGVVISIVLTNPGSGYEFPPTIQITDGADGTGASATAFVDANGEIDRVIITNPGSGYFATPSYTLANTNGGTGFVAQVIGGGKVESVTITNPGSGYKVAPTVTLAGTGTGASIKAVSTAVGVKIANAVKYDELFSNGISTYGEFAARYAGKLGNSIRVSMVDAATWEFQISGVITSSVSSDIVNGLGTQFLSELEVGTTVVDNQGRKIGVVKSLISDVSLRLESVSQRNVFQETVVAKWAFQNLFNGAPGTSDYARANGSVNDELHIAVVDVDGKITGIPGGLIQKIEYASKASDAIDFQGQSSYYAQVIRSKSSYIYQLSHPSETSNWGQATSSISSYDLLSKPVTATLVGGTDDFTVTSGNYRAAWDTFLDTVSYDIGLLPVGAATASEAQYVIDNIATKRGDAVAFHSISVPGSGAPILGTSETRLSDAQAYRSAVGDSSYAFLDSGFYNRYDKYNDKIRLVPLNGQIAGLAARTDKTDDAWYSFGGLTRGQIKNVVKLCWNPTQAERDVLYPASINPVVTLPNQGTVLYGDKTMTAKPSAFDRINVRRLFIALRKSISRSAQYQLFEFNDAITRQQFVGSVEPFLRNVQGRRGIEAFKVVCDETNNGPEVRANNEFRGAILVKPNYSVNFIELTFTAVGPQVDFSIAANV